MYYDSPVLFLTLRGPWWGARCQSGLRRNFSDQLYTWFGIISGRTVEQVSRLGDCSGHHAAHSRLGQER
jgi:hypothetical protein